MTIAVDLDVKNQTKTNIVRLVLVNGDDHDQTASSV